MALHQVPTEKTTVLLSFNQTLRKRCFARPTRLNAPKSTRFTHTILAPVGVENANEIVIPTIKLTTATITDVIITPL